VAVHNVAPTIDVLTAPVDPVSIDEQPISIEVAWSDPAALDTHNVTWQWGDGGSDMLFAATSPVSYTHTYTEVGVFDLTVTVVDDDDGVASLPYKYIVIYDPYGGFVTGGGWIWSEAGSCRLTSECEATEGKASFGFVSRYKRGASEPTGETEFQFEAGNLSFYSDSYEWLVIAGASARFKGVGTINGAGEYGFLLTATDAALTPSTGVDLFRIKIWDRASDEVVYDNRPNESDDSFGGTEIGGGNIKLHKG
jgi:hypothetical protein